MKPSVKQFLLIFLEVEKAEGEPPVEPPHKREKFAPPSSATLFFQVLTSIVFGYQRHFYWFLGIARPRD